MKNKIQIIIVLLILFSIESIAKEKEKRILLGIGFSRITNITNQEVSDFSKIDRDTVLYNYFEITYLSWKKLSFEFNYFMPQDNRSRSIVANLDNSSSIISLYSTTNSISYSYKVAMNYFFFNGFEVKRNSLGIQFGVGNSSSFETKFQKFIPQFYESESILFINPNSMTILSEKKTFLSLGLLAIFRILDNFYLKYVPELKVYSKENQKYLINSFKETINSSSIDLRNTYLSQIYFESKNENRNNLAIDFNFSVIYNF